MSAAFAGTPGVLYGVGLGPGDPELVTVKAARIIGAADVVAYHSARHGRSVARSIAEPYLRGDQIEEQLVYPVTTETTAHPGGYEGAIEEFYERAAGRLMAHLAAGRDVVLLAEGDPLFYSSYMHMHKRISSRFTAVIVPGITSVSAASAALSMPLVEGNDVLTVLPGTLGTDELTRRLRGTDAAAIMKISRSYAGVRAALKESGRLEQAFYVERASGGSRQLIEPAGEVDPAAVPYMSIVMVPGAEAAGIPAPASGPGSRAAAVPQRSGHAAPESAAGRVDVVGLGPAGRDWLTPQALAVLAAADDIVGYGPYVDRVPPNPRQRRHGSDNRVEAQRAEFALDLALRGRRVAVVSSGDPGVFAMATAVLEVAADDQRFAGVPVDVIPGLTAAQAVASQAGAPLGHDYVVLSLSDNLKPWEIIARRLAAAATADFAIAI
jgi:precorrin-2 C20-methyltransferase/precorrin-3B C17-methyltransferase